MIGTLIVDDRLWLEWAIRIRLPDIALVIAESDLNELEVLLAPSYGDLTVCPVTASFPNASEVYCSKSGTRTLEVFVPIDRTIEAESIFKEKARQLFDLVLSEQDEHKAWNVLMFGKGAVA